MKVLVTGGSGFIGTNMVSLLIEKGFDVVNYDIIKPKLESHLKFWINVDICNKSEISSFIPKEIKSDKIKAAEIKMSRVLKIQNTLIVKLVL